MRDEYCNSYACGFDIGRSPTFVIPAKAGNPASFAGTPRGLAFAGTTTKWYGAEHDARQSRVDSEPVTEAHSHAGLHLPIGRRARQACSNRDIQIGRASCRERV